MRLLSLLILLIILIYYLILFIIKVVNKAKKIYKNTNKKNKKIIKIILPIILILFILSLLIIILKPILLSHANDKIKESSIPNNYTDISPILDKVYEKEKNNIVLSNQSLDMALAMILENSTNKEQKELEKYLKINKEDLNKYKLILNRYKYLNNKAAIYNSYWYSDAINNTYTKDQQKEYQNSIKKDLNASSYKIEFDSTGIKKMNKWVSKNTNGLIKNFLSEDEVPENTEAISINTLYFNEKWKDKFTDDEVEDYTFTKFDGSTQSIKMLLKDEADITYYENDKAEAFAYNYKDDFEFIGILPTSNEDFNLEDIDIEELLENGEDSTAKIGIPEFENEGKYELTDYLKEIMPNTFNPKINKDNYIGKVLQGTYIKVDKNGTKAVAVTSAIDMQWGNINGFKEIILNRPFAFLIRDKVTKQILFTGKIIEIKNND